MYFFEGADFNAERSRVVAKRIIFQWKKEVFQRSLLKSSLSFGNLWNVLMLEKWGDNGKKTLNSEMRKRCLLRLVELSGWYLVNAWWDIATKLQYFSPSAYSIQISEEFSIWSVDISFQSRSWTLTDWNKIRLYKCACVCFWRRLHIILVNQN